MRRTTKRSRAISIAATATLVAAFVGCGGESRYPVSGVVSSKGAPLAEVRVLFFSNDGVVVGDALTDAAGGFEVSGGGLPEGRYDLAVVPLADLNSDVTADDPQTSVDRLVDAKYASPYGSGLSVEVGPGREEALRLALD